MLAEVGPMATIMTYSEFHLLVEFLYCCFHSVHIGKT